MPLITVQLARADGSFDVSQDAGPHRRDRPGTWPRRARHRRHASSSRRFSSPADDRRNPRRDRPRRTRRDLVPFGLTSKSFLVTLAALPRPGYVV